MDIIDSERARNEISFRDEGKYQIISGRDVEEGTYFVDTRPAESALGYYWESNYRLKQKGGNPIVLQDEDEDPDTTLRDLYGPTGCGITLWSYSKDPNGIYARKMHEKILELLKRNTSAYELVEQVDKFRRDFDRQIKSSPPRLSF